MFAKERQDKIYELLQNNGAVMTSQLVKSFEVSIETIRRDLLLMEENGQLTRVHGGAVLKSDMKSYPALSERNNECSNEKKELSDIAMHFITENDIIGVDTGSTAISFAQSLKEHFSRLTIVTHSCDVFEILRNHKDFSVILCGGYYLKNEKSFYGELALETLKKLHLKKSFIFPSAISLSSGIYDFQPELYQIQKELIKSSDEIFILADSSKFEKTGLLKLDDMNSEYTYVTDSALQTDLKKVYAENGIKIFTNTKG